MPVRFSLSIKQKESANNFVEDNSSLFLQGTNNSTIVLIHGLTGSPKEMGFLARSFNKSGYSVYTPRLANHGKSVETLRDTTWQEFYNSLSNEFAQNSKLSSGPIFVAGLSVGALFALKLSLDFPTKVAGVTCLSPILYYDGWNSSKWRHLLPLVYLTPLKKYFYFKEEPPYGIKNEAIQRLVHQHYMQKELDDVINFYDQGYPFYPVSLLYQHHLFIKHLKYELPKIKTPVQLIQAHEDDMSSPKNSKYIYEQIASSKKEIYTLYNSYHVITADQERMTVVNEMQRFYNEVLNNKQNA